MSSNGNHIDTPQGRPEDTGSAPAAFARVRRAFLVLAAAGALAAAVAWVITPRQFYFSWLVAHAFVLTTVLGLLFFVMLHHVTDAGWSVVLRRAAEQCLTALPPLAALFLPVLVGMRQLYAWMRPAGPTDQHLVAAKWPFLTPWFFVAWAVVCFAVWWLLARVMRGTSLRQDHTGEPHLSLRMRRWSGPGLLLYALTLTFAFIQWLMTLDHAWFSTIFGVYIFSGAVAGALGTLTILTLALDRGGPLRGLILTDHLHDLGKLMFAFSVFWAYIAFSQYFLIWYSNIPEETTWFIRRWQGAWQILSILLPAGNFVVPFFVLMSAKNKRRRPVLLLTATALVAVHWIDLYWIVMPQGQAAWRPATLWVDAACVACVVGVCGWVVTRALARAAPYPLRDPRLAESLALGHEETAAGADYQAEGM